MGNPILQLGDSLRRIQSEQTLKRIEPQIKEIRADYERQIAERDAEITELRRKNDELLNCLVVEQQENADHIAEIASLTLQLAERPAGKVLETSPTTKRKKASK